MKKLSILLAMMIIAMPFIAYAGVSHWKDNEDYHIDRYEDTRYGTVCYVVSNSSNLTKQPSISCVKK